MSDGKVGNPGSSDHTQAAYFENLGIREGLGRLSDPLSLLERWFEIEEGLHAVAD